MNKNSSYIVRMKMMLVTAFLCGTDMQVYAQTKQNIHVNQAWAAYFNQTRFSNRWGTWADLHLRTREDFVSDVSTTILRFGLTYFVNTDTRLTAGYAYVTSYFNDGTEGFSQPEHRPWQQIFWNTNYPRLRLNQRLRLEERFRRKLGPDNEPADGYDFNWRLRYHFLMTVPLSKNAFAPRTFSFVFNDEVFFNFGKQIVYNAFDQNRFFVGFSYHTNNQDNFQFGYSHVLQQLPSGTTYRHLHLPRLSYFHNLDLRKK